MLKSQLHFAPNHVTNIGKLSGYRCFNTRSVAKETIVKLLLKGIKIVQAQQSLIKEMQGKARSFQVILKMKPSVGS